MSKEQIKMPWGKHRGKWISELPIDYLKWIILNYTNQQGIAQVCAEELVRREPQLKRKNASRADA